jgi:uncharacterized iron-regulated membrane protein
MGRSKPRAAPVTSKGRIDAYDAVNRLEPTVSRLDLAYPVLIVPPMQPGGSWTARSDAQNRTQRATLTLDAKSGAVIRRDDFGSRNWVDQAVGVGVAAHEGQLFGWPNQLLSLFTALGLATASISAVVLWWTTRAAGVLGVPRPGVSPRFSKGLLFIIVALGALLPLLGVSLLVVLTTETLVLRRIPVARDWLGLRTVRT